MCMCMCYMGRVGPFAFLSKPMRPCVVNLPRFCASGCDTNPGFLEEIGVVVIDIPLLAVIAIVITITTTRITLITVLQ